MTTLETAEKLFPTVNKVFNIVNFLNGGIRPKKIDYDELVSWPDLVLCGLAEHLCLQVDRLLTPAQILTIAKLVKPVIKDNFLNNVTGAQEIVVDVFDDTTNKWLLVTGQTQCYNLNTGAYSTHVCGKPAEAHLYNLQSIAARLNSMLKTAAV